MTYDEIKEKLPEDFASRELDKYHYRYPSGEVGVCSPSPLDSLALSCVCQQYFAFVYQMKTVLY